MLENSTYRKFIELNWLDIWKNESNPSQFWHRIRTQVNRAINQLIILANKLPDEKQQEIFNYSDIKKLIISVLKKDNYADPLDEISDARRTQLAALFVEEGIKVCIKKYGLLLNETPTLTEPAINHLDKAKDICNEIAFKVDLGQRKIVAEAEKLIYLFNWNRIPKNESDNNRLAEFIKEEFGEFDFRWIKSIRKLDEGNTIFFSYRDYLKPVCTFYIKLTDDKKAAMVYNYDPELNDEDLDNNSKKVTRNLLVKLQYDNLYVYKNKN